MWSAILGFFGGIFSFIGKVVPMIGAYFAGKKAAKAEVLENTIKAKTEAEQVGQTVKDELRKKPVGDYIRDNDI